MNKYLIAALYVMAGCAVTIPLKAQPGGEPLRGDRGRLVITNTVKVVSACLEEDMTEQDYFSLPPEYYFFPPVKMDRIHPVKSLSCRIHSGSLCRTSCKIRAPGKPSLL